ncbi:MAG: type IV toxin-antitoxin system AbiEi family antitoxin domain-containing protein [Actinobacteria bacterium]|nr:type IV toxin-antitoxin system AbiEi family antitoxin domain-containing protein [Actinomycetota bacterium]
MARDLPPQLRDLAEYQLGVLSRAQILDSGLSKGLIRARLDRGSWQRLSPGVYAAFSGQPVREALLWAAVLDAGPGAMLSHETAAEVDHLTDSVTARVHVTVPGCRRVRGRPGIAIHYSARAAQKVHPARTPPRTRIEETVLDLWESAVSLDDAVSWVARGIGRRLTTQHKLLEATRARSKLAGRVRLAELLSPDAAGLHSILEHRYVRHVERPHQLPAGTRQAKTARGGRTEYRDTLYEHYGLVVELDGRVAHPGDTRWADIERDNAAAAEGFTTLRYGWLAIATTPCEVAAEVARLLTARGYTGARPCSPGCPVTR